MAAKGTAQLLGLTWQLVGQAWLHAPPFGYCGNVGPVPLEESLRRALDRLREVHAALEEVPLGGTAVGTGINTHPEFAARALAFVNERTGLKLRPSADRFEGLGSRHAVVAASESLLVNQEIASALCGNSFGSFS